MKSISLFFVWICFHFPGNSYLGKSKPNIIYLMLDEWGYFESGHMGSTDLITPISISLHRKVCVSPMPMQGLQSAAHPLLITHGLHAGNMSMRVNNGHSPFGQMNRLLASMLKTKGYATGGFGNGELVDGEQPAFLRTRF